MLVVGDRFSEIAKQAPQPVTPRVQQANVIIPQSRQELFGNRPSAAMGAAARLKKVVRRMNSNEKSASDFPFSAKYQQSAWFGS